MPDEKLAFVNDIADNGRLIVGFINGDGSATVLNRASDVEVGDIVTIEGSIAGDNKATEVVKKVDGTEGIL